MGIKEQVFKQSIEIYGKEAQSRQAMEECAELIQAINKCLRYPSKEECKNNLIEEICDVEIMLFQLKEMFGITNEAVETLQELVDFNKTFAHVLGNIDFKALRNILETKLPKKPIKKETVTLSMLNIDVTFGKCPTCGSALAGKQNYCTKCGQAIDWEG